MRERINKPRVFLSYARNDATFIDKLEKDLRKCQIDSWRDQNDIRDGQPWMKAIFEDGIPTCDAILGYFTEDALKSKMVAKEIDSAILRQLNDNKIAFLPYVDNEGTRKKLRVDIQTLQSRVWDKENYLEILPSVVAEIWRSFLERSIENATLQEKTKRLELELEVNRLNELQGSGVFATQEEREFQYIFDKFDFAFDVSISAVVEKIVDGNPQGKNIGSWDCKVSYIYFLVSYLKRGNFNFENYAFFDLIGKIISSENLLPSTPKRKSVGVKGIKLNLLTELRRYDLVSREITGANIQHYVNRFTQKMNRFVFWIEYNEVKGNVPIIEYGKFVKSTEKDKTKAKIEPNNPNLIEQIGIR